MILQHDNAPLYTAKYVRDTVSALGKEFLPHPPYSPDLVPSDYHLFSSMSHALSMKHFNNYGDVKKWLNDWTISKDVRFLRKGIHKLLDTWEKSVTSDGAYLE